MALKEFLNESGPKSYHLALLQMVNQLSDLEDQASSLGSEINIAMGQGLYPAKSSNIVIQLMNLTDSLAKVRSQAEKAAKESKKLK